MRDVVLDFRLEPDTGREGFRVHLAAAGRNAQAEFAFDLADRHLRTLRQRIDQESCPVDDLKEIGVNLWTGLMSGEVGTLFDALRAENRVDRAHFLFRLSLQHPDLELLPWEALYYEDYEEGFGFLACNPAYTLVRAPTRARAATVRPPLAGPLRILAVIPAGSGLDADREWRNLQQAVERVRDRVELERLEGRVTPDVLADRLRSQRWDIFHFIGHGEQTESGRTAVCLNSEEALDQARWLDGEAFGNLFFDSGVRLAVLNCCKGAMPSPQRRMSGLGPYFLRAGVPAVVAMRYEIEDRAAIRFSLRFYQDLLAGRTPGRVDLAVESAREALYRNQTEDAARPFITPVLFLHGEPRLFDLTPAGEATGAVPAPVEAPRLPLPERLVQALREGRCVPVVGPRVLTASPLRSGPPATDARQLAKTLAQHFGYPRTHDFALCEAAGDWMDAILLQWVCQLAQRGREFFQITEAIETAYRSSQPPTVLSRITEWNVPAIFYLYFDGLLEEAFDRRRSPVRVVHGVDKPVPPGDDPVLVHVQGTRRDVETLVLTEDDHLELWDRMARMTPEILNLVRGHSGRSLFFLGTSPRDPLVKRLFSKLIENWSERSRGPIFFHCRKEERGEPYWERYNVHWIDDADLADCVEALTAAARKGGQPS